MEVISNIVRRQGVSTTRVLTYTPNTCYFNKTAPQIGKPTELSGGSENHNVPLQQI